MPSSWKWKAWLLGGLCVLAAYLLVPTIFNFGERRERAEAAGENLPWYFSAFQDKGINLGLDLRGGIYLEFEIEADRAIANKVDSMASDLERRFKKDGVAFEAVRQDVGSHSVIISGLTKDGASKALDIVNEDYDGVLVKALAPQEGALAFALGERYSANLKDQILKQALDKVRNRVDKYGVAEPTIQRLESGRIAIELPGMKDPDRAIGIIKKAGQLEFKIVDDSVKAADLAAMVAEARKGAELPDDDYSSKASDRINDFLRGRLPPDDEIAFETQYDPVAKKVAGGRPYLLHRRAMVTGEMLKDAKIDFEDNSPYVIMAFDAQGAQLFGEATSKNVGKEMAILLDGTVTKAPVIREPILGGHAQITLDSGRSSRSSNELLKEAQDLMFVLQEGALPAQLTEAMKTAVGPSLGADSIRSGIAATFIGALIVCAFMILYYRWSGAIADAAVILNLALILAALALFQATLTLPGIAGIALTLGMAVDANVLINERIREELRAGKSARAAVEAGYSNAMRAIIDSNVTTLMAGVVLYFFGTGPVKGFAVTLFIGLLISMYTACVCTRMVYDYLLIKRKLARISI